MRKIFIFGLIIISLLLTVACTKNSVDCENTINSILKDNKELNSSQIAYLKEQNLNIQSSIFPKFEEGNRGINPPVSYFVIDNKNNKGYYYVTGGFYSEKWYGPYTGNLPFECFSKGK